MRDPIRYRPWSVEEIQHLRARAGVGKTGRAGAGSGDAGRGSRAVRSSAAAATAIARASLCDGTGRIASNRPLSLRIWIHQPSCGTSVRTAV